MKSFVLQVQPKQEWTFSMDIIIGITLVLIAGVIFLLMQNGSGVSVKSKALKKDEIIENYENELKKILLRYKDNKTKQIEQKKLFLQKCSSEFSRNMFFNEDEAKQIIQRFAQL